MENGCFPNRVAQISAWKYRLVNGHMKSRVKKIFTLLAGWGFIALGVIGLFLPILQGVLFLIIGLLILSSEYVWAHRLLQRLRARFPRIAQVWNKAEEISLKWRSKFSGPVKASGKTGDGTG